MDQLGDELKKMLKAGLGAVAAGAEKAQEAIETLSKKGEPLYEQAKSAVTDAAGKIRQAVNESGIREAMSGKRRVEDVIDDLRGMTPEDWAQVRQALDQFEALAAQRAEAAPGDEPETGCPEGPEARPDCCGDAVAAQPDCCPDGANNPGCCPDGLDAKNCCCGDEDASSQTPEDQPEPPVL